MTETESLIADLDEFLVDSGEDIKLRRVVGATNQVNVDVECRAAVRSPTAQEVIDGIDQRTFFCILSPTEINERQWPGGQPPTVTGDPRIPSNNRGDMAFIHGAWRAVQWGQGFYPQGVLVRIEIRVLG